MGVNRRGQVRMSAEEVQAFLRQERNATMCSFHPDGSIHAVAMWYALINGEVAVTTKRKSQKVQNLRRDPRLTFLVETGGDYGELRGVTLSGRARILEDPDDLWDEGVSMWEARMGPYDETQRHRVEALVHNRVIVVLETEKVVSWDHRKLRDDRP
jgi:PPOX class probable F420-dependent enzyme